MATWEAGYCCRQHDCSRPKFIRQSFPRQLLWNNRLIYCVWQKCWIFSKSSIRIEMETMKFVCDRDGKQKDASHDIAILNPRWTFPEINRSTSNILIPRPGVRRTGRSSSQPSELTWTFGPSIYRYFSPFISFKCQMCQLYV